MENKRDYPPPADRHHSGKRNKSKVNIFAQVTAKIEPIILTRFSKEETEARLRFVSNKAGVELIRFENSIAFQGKWRAVAQAQLFLKSLYVKSVTDSIEDRVCDHCVRDDDKVSLGTSKCGSVFSGSSNHSKSKIVIGNLTEKVAMALERSTSALSQILSDDSSKRQSCPESDKEARQPRDENQPQVPPKRTSLFSNLIHHKKSYIYKCAALALADRNEKENDSDATKRMLMIKQEMWENKEMSPPLKKEDSPSVCEEPTVAKIPMDPSPPPVHYESVFEPRFLHQPFTNQVPITNYPAPVVIARPHSEFTVDARFNAPAPHARLHSEPPVPSFSPSPIIRPIQPQQPNFTFEPISHEAFYYQNRGFIPQVFSLPNFPEIPETKPLPEEWVPHNQPPPPLPNSYMLPQTPTEFKCDECDFVTPDRRNLVHHEKRVHVDKVHKCHLCERSYTLKSDLTIHLRSHNVKHRCDECGRTYKSHRVLKQHQLTHEGTYIKPTFYCNDCGKSFSTKYVLQNHVDNVHKGKQPAFVCKVCDKRFTQKHSLTEHQNIHLGLKPFKCDTCQKSFSFRTSLSQHVLLHGSKRNYRCEECGKSFLQKNSLRLHSAIHSDHRAHCCSYCGKGFTQKQAMLRHERIHNGEKPYSCDICGRAFNDSSILRRHMHVHRKNNTTPEATKPANKMMQSTPTTPVNLPPMIPTDHLMVNDNLVNLL